MENLGFLDYIMISSFLGCRYSLGAVIRGRLCAGTIRGKKGEAVASLLPLHA